MLPFNDDHQRLVVFNTIYFLYLYCFFQSLQKSRVKVVYGTSYQKLLVQRGLINNQLITDLCQILNYYFSLSKQQGVKERSVQKGIITTDIITLFQNNHQLPPIISLIYQINQLFIVQTKQASELVLTLVAKMEQLGQLINDQLGYYQNQLLACYLKRMKQ